MNNTAIEFKPSTNQLYDYQIKDLENLFGKISAVPSQHRLLYQLPTGGGKTRIFSELSHRFINHHKRSVVILTHRVELCKQTSKTLKTLGVVNKIIDSNYKVSFNQTVKGCYVAMIESLNHRIMNDHLDTDDVGLVIIDEAHHNAFHKLIDKFSNAIVIGVTATPISSDMDAPMNKTYNEIILGEQVETLITKGFLAKPTTWRYDVELNTLQTGQNGDFTTSTSDEFYSSPAMLDLLLHAYKEHALGSKTLIFNNGIFTSNNVLNHFKDAGFQIRHLDNHTPATERAEILKWFKKTKGAILTSVSILTTGFDEPTVQSVILNRATTSLTLFHQMIGRGSRMLPNKKNFSIIDLGNNADRFGHWNDPIDWKDVFEHPEAYHQAMHIKTEFENHHLPSALHSMFPNSAHVAFDIQKEYHNAIERNVNPKLIIKDSLDQHVKMCVDNSVNIANALLLIKELEKEIEWRIKQYSKCVGKVTKNYTEWLIDDYKSKLSLQIQEQMAQAPVSQMAS